jgi:hypothetical protein
VDGDLSVWIAVGGLALLCLSLLAIVVLTRRAWTRDARLAHAELGDLRARVEELEHEQVPRPTAAPSVPTEYLITGLGDAHARDDDAPTSRIERAVFADTVLRETVVKAASLAHGVRRGLAPATRNRIRFEMKQEVRRSRKQRRADLKAAQRNLHAQQRRAMTGEAS